MRRLGPADYRAMPWKNGGGSTTELLIHPPGATLEGGFLWRLSMADVAASGPFSAFPGVDRTLLLISGNGMELDHGEHGRQRLAGPLEPVAFSGDWTTQGRLLDGPCRDFNVLSVRGKVRHKVEVLHFDRQPVALPEAGTLVAFCVRDQVAVDGEDLKAMDLIVLDEPGRHEACSSTGAGGLVVVAFF